MADDIFTLDTLVTGRATLVLTDDGTGSDTIRVAGLCAGVVNFLLAPGTDAGFPISASATYSTNGGANAHTLVINGPVENVTGGNGDDEILGDSDIDLKSGGAGIDTINGGSGRDTIEGGAGADALSGGAPAGDTLS